MIVWSRRWALKFGIVLTTSLTVYWLMKEITSDAVKCQAAYEVEPTAEVLLTSPFVKDEPKLVILLSYQRSGSSFVGEWFNTNPDIFYNFEPVDSLYSAMYGTPQNANVPSDITNYPNGSARIVPDEELSAVSTFLLQFLVCDLESLPTESFLSFYFMISYDHLASTAYTKCIRSAFKIKYNQCENNVRDFCGTRFGEAPEANQRECLQRLWLKQNNPSTFSEMFMKFRFHEACTDTLRQEFKPKCQHLLEDSCQNRSIRVMKTVRATMESMEPLLQALPNFRVIHLVRDPRAVALSRSRFKGYVRGIYSGYNETNTLRKEAKLFCSTVVRDIKTRLRLEKKYPGKIFALNFDKLITNTTLYLENVYRFLDGAPHENTVAWLWTKGSTNPSKKTPDYIANQWQESITFRENKEIIESCKEFYDLVKFDWAV